MKIRHKVYAGVLGAGILAGGLTIATAAGLGNLLPSQFTNANSDYSLTLNSSNAYSSGTEKYNTTDQGKSNIAFTYTNCTASSGNHALIGNGGSIVNKDIIHSISQFNATFTGKIQIRTSYDAQTWGSYFNINSGETIALGSNPYFVEMKAVDGSATLTSAKYFFTCQENPDIPSGEDEWRLVKSASELKVNDEVIVSALNDNYAMSIQPSGTHYRGRTSITKDTTNNTLTKSSETAVYTLKSGTKSNTFGFYFHGYSTASNTSKTLGNYYLDANQPSYTSLYTTTTISDTSSFSISIDSLTYAATIKSSGTNAKNTITHYAGSDRFNANDKFVDNGSYVCIYKKYTGSDAPVDEIGFTIDDTNKNTYNDQSVYATSNGLVVRKHYSDGSTSIASSSEYSYVVKNSNGVVINHNQPFGASGVYQVVVTHGSFLPVSLNITVGEEYHLTSITVNSSTLTFNTAQKLSDFTSGITADLHYNKSIYDISGISYASFGSNNLTLSLLDPNGVTKSINDAFAVNGKWTIKVTHSSNVIGTLEITVNAIEVISVSLDQTTASLEVGKTVQLVASINPDNATNKNVTWTSSSEGVATVTANGLVTAVSAGTTTITVTTVNGSHIATCVVTVSEPAPDEKIGLYSHIDGSEIAIGSYVIITNSYNSGSRKAMSTTQNTNNRSAADVTISDAQTINYTGSETYAVFKVEEGTTSGTYSFYDEVNEGYIYAASSTSNQLKTETTKSANSSWTVGSDILAQGSNTRKKLQYNSGNDIFSCYALNIDTQSAVYLFQKGAEPVYPESISISGNSSTNIGETLQLSVNYLPSETTYKNTTWESSDTSVATVNDDGLVTGVKAGSSIITATARTASGTITATKTITISNVSVTGVSLDLESKTINAGESFSLTATISPSNATNKNVTWTTSNSAIAIVSDGEVTGVAKGNATITVTSVDGNKKATCNVTVKESAAPAESFTIDKNTFDAVNSGSGYTAYDGTRTISGVDITSSDVMIQSQKLQFRRNNSSNLYSATSKTLNKITLNNVSGSPTVYGGTSPSSINNQIAGENNVYSLVGYTYFKVCGNNSAAITMDSIVVTCGEAPKVNPTGVTLDKSSAELSAGSSLNLTVGFTPSDCNQNKGVTWSSSNTNVATVDQNGKVTTAANAVVGSTTTITVRSTYNTSFTATCTIRIIEQQIDAWTVMLYMCGSNLESDDGSATDDIREILTASNQPDDVNILVETGGSTKWQSTYGIDKNGSHDLERWHVANKKLVKDSTVGHYDMSAQSTFQDFIEWGLTTYPAQKTAVILWNHGGAMEGVCYDDNFNGGNAALLNKEVSAASKGAISTVYGSNSTRKLEMIGYDACLMNVQDIASTNADSYNYMVASQESEWGYGWSYDAWVPTLYQKPSTKTILDKIVDSFGEDTTSSYEYWEDPNDQTLAWLDLSQMGNYITAWENLATALSNKLTDGNKSSFATLLKTGKYFDDCNRFGSFDVIDFINNLQNNSTFKVDSSTASAVKTAHGHLVGKYFKGNAAGNANGLCLYWPVNRKCNKNTNYTESDTKLSTWRGLAVSYGY